MRLKATIISLVSILLVGLTAILLYCFWPAIKGTVENSKYYTQEELQESYDKGYNDGCKSETELTGQVKYYKGLVDEYYVQVNTLNSEITMLTKNNKDYQSQVNNLTTQKTELQTQVDNLATIKTNNENTISSLNNQITNLQNQVTNLENIGEDKSEQIITLNNQIKTLQNTVAQLQTTNDMNVTTITSLNSQIANLNSQISDMTLLSQNSTSQINALNSKISELEKSITYYESYISQLETGEQVVATFEFDGSVYNIQIVNKNSKLSVTTPTSTAYKIFNGWKVDNKIVDLTTYTITANTKFVADVTYKFDVKFMDGETVVKSDIVVKDSCATLPTTPTKTGYEFDGWSINGVDIVENIETTSVTANTTYKAVWTKLYTVTFMYESETKSTQTIRNGSCATAPTIESTTYKIFNGWKFNNDIVDISNYTITQDIVFVADITYKYDVKFMVDGSVYASQIIATNGYATAPTVNDFEYKTFNGWRIDNVLVNASQYKITQETTFYADFTIKTVSLTAQNFLNYVYSVGQNTITSILFDYYTNDNEYKVNGVNVIDGISGDLLDSDGKIKLYQNGTALYVLSKYNIQIDTGRILFLDMRKLTTLKLNNLNTSSVTDMSKMFSGCTALTSLDLSNFNTSNVTNMGFMFENCSNLIDINLSSFNTNKVTYMQYMFYRCMNLSSIDISSFNTSNVLYMMGMFSGCSKLTVLDLSNFNTNKVTRFDTMFRYCSALKTIYANENFVINEVDIDESCYIDGSSDTFSGCENLVGAISYDSSKVDCYYANYSTGYFTYKAKQ